MEDVRMLVQEEGRAARNQVAFHVDVAAPPGRAANRKPPSSPRLTSEPRITKRSTMATKTGSRVRSASVGRDKKTELQARFWGMLFGNLQSVVDEIYQTCEKDESISGCKEVILILENHIRDFRSLIQWFRLKWEYENTPPPQRPNSLAWEVRKSSPSKVISYKLEKLKRSEKTSQGKKLDFCSDVKLSTAQEIDKRVPTPEKEETLTNRYGLSFGDVNLQDHLGLESSGVTIRENSVRLGEANNRASNKENDPMMITENKIKSLQPHKDMITLNNDQSSQTEEICLQNETSQKNLIRTPLLMISKKAPPSSLAKSASVVPPITIVKTNQSVSGRKTVPTSPTSTAPPRSVVPGRNVAAVSFVPAKKPVSTTQPKANAVMNRSNLNAVKTSAVNLSERNCQQDCTVQVTSGNDDPIAVNENEIVQQKLLDCAKPVIEKLVNSLPANNENFVNSKTLAKSDQHLQEIVEVTEEKSDDNGESDRIQAAFTPASQINSTLKTAPEAKSEPLTQAKFITEPTPQLKSTSNSHPTTQAKPTSELLPQPRPTFEPAKSSGAPTPQTKSASEQIPQQKLTSESDLKAKSAGAPEPQAKSVSEQILQHKPGSEHALQAKSTAEPITQLKPTSEHASQTKFTVKPASQAKSTSELRSQPKPTSEHALQANSSVVSATLENCNSKLVAQAKFTTKPVFQAKSTCESMAYNNQGQVLTSISQLPLQLSVNEKRENSQTSNGNSANVEKSAGNIDGNALKVEKCDKIVMTDFPPIGATVPKKPKPFGLTRNKTAPSFMRKSSETINTTNALKTSDSDKSETVKHTCISTVPSKFVPKVVKKQVSLPEGVSERPPFITSRIYRSNTALELRPVKRRPNRSVSNAFGQSITEGKQVTSFKNTSNTNNKSTFAKPPNPEVSKSHQNLRKKNSVDEDGWETVQGRSRSRPSLSQSSGNIKAFRLGKAGTRFHLPSPATSLPTLALAVEEPEPLPKSGKVDKNKQNEEIAKANKSGKKEEDASAAKCESASKKIKGKEEGERKEGEKKEGVERKKIPYVRAKSSSDLKKKGIGNKVAAPTPASAAANDNKLDKLMDILSSEDERINEEEIRKSKELYEEEKMLTKEIQDLEKAEIEMDTETDDAETDGEANIGGEDDDTDSRISALRASYEDVCDQLSWADQIDTWEKLEQLEQMALDTSAKGNSLRRMTLQRLEELESRHPGRALELHQKLSSPSRRHHATGGDALRRHQARQASAKRKRDQLLMDKSNRIRELLNRVEEVKQAQSQLVEERKRRLEDKLRRAEENRASHLRSIQRKAHDEEEKLREIAFINELSSQNKRHDFMALCQEQQDRLQGILDERQRKQEEKAAKEAAVEERRRIIEAERQEKLEKMQERRRNREERIGREQQEKEKERQEIAREKARDRVERLQALQAAQLATVEELQKKIQQKQSESARRHEENIEHIRQRALESGALRAADDDAHAPRLTPYDTHKLCRVCNVMIESEVYLLSHLRGKAHQEAMRERDDGEEVIMDAPRDKMDAKIAQDRERLKALRKRCKKIRSRMAQRGEEYLTKQGPPPKKVDGPSKCRLQKCLKEVDRLHATQGVGQWPNNAITLLERNLSEINRILDKQNSLDQKVFRELNGFTTLSNILNLALDIPKNMSPYLPPRCFLTTCSVYSLACQNNPDNSRFVFCSNKIALVLDLLLNRLNTLITDDYRASQKSSANLSVDPVAGALMRLFALILSQAQEDASSDLADMAIRLQDMISYTVSVGVVDNLALYCSSVRDPIDGNVQAADFLLGAVQLLTTLAKTNCGLTRGDPTQLVATLRVTELVGGVSMLYGMLLTPSQPPAPLPPLAVAVTMATLRLMRAVAQLDLHMFQSVLGAEGMSLQLRHVASYLLRYCSQADERELLHEVIHVVGYFAVMNYENQMILQSGHNPTVLQQLINLPFEYFSNPNLSCHLLPTLLACCHDNPDNKAILTQDLSYQLLEDFKQSESGKANPLIHLLK